MSDTEKKVTGGLPEDLLTDEFKNPLVFFERKGKVRNIYEPGLIFKTSDRLSVFDRVVCDKIPYKGIALNCISQENKKRLKKLGYETDYIETFDELFNVFGFYDTGRMAYCKPLTMIPLEIIVRGVLTGSAYKAYKKGESYCGHRFPDGMKNGDKLVCPIVTPTTKEKTGHDRPVDKQQAQEVVTNWLMRWYKEGMVEQARDEAIQIVSELYKLALNIFHVISEEYEKHDIMLVDTKFEFGLDEEGYIILADEVGTPDSSRLVPKSVYEKTGKLISLDKQEIRDFFASKGFTGDEEQEVPNIPEELIAKLSEKYIDVARTLFGDMIASQYFK